MIQIDFSLLLQIVNFLFLILILNFLLYKPLLAIIDKRNGQIENERGEINRLNRAVEEKMAAYEEKVRDTKLEVLDKNKHLIKEGSDQAKDILEGVSKEISALTEQYHAKLQEEILVARESLSGQYRMISLEIAEKVLGRGIKLILFIISFGFTLGITVLHASTGGGDPEAGKNWVGFGWRAFNFLVLAGLLYWLMAGKVKDFFGSRQNDVKATLQGLAVAKEEAEKKFAEYNAKLDKATEEIHAMADMIRRQGFAEKERIIADAQKAAEKMKDDARKRMDHEVNMARHDLRDEAVRLSVQMTQEILKQNITVTDHAAMVGDYIDKVVSKH